MSAPIRTAAALTAAVLASTLAAVTADAYPADTVQVPSALETTASGVTGDNVDDPAIWVDQADPSQSLVIGNEKKARRLSVYDLAGNVVQTIYDRGVFYGNVDVRGDLVVVAHNGIVVYRVVDHRLVYATEATGNATGGGEGLCLWQQPGGALQAVQVVKSTFRVRVHPLTDADADGLLQVQKPVKQWFQPSEGESCVVDDATGLLYLAEEDRGIWKVDLNDPAVSPARSLFVTLSANLTADVEGLQVDGGTLIASAQNGTGAASKANWLAMFDKATGAWLGNFRVGDGAASDDCDQTDGIALYRGRLSDQFPAGLFVCQDGYNDLPGGFGSQDFKFASLADLPLPLPGAAS